MLATPFREFLQGGLASIQQGDSRVAGETPDIYPDCRRYDRAIGSDDRAHRGAYAHMHVGHRRDVMMHDGQLRHVDELLARLGLDLSGIDLHRDAAFVDG